jgi:hypothetical protein
MLESRTILVVFVGPNHGVGGGSVDKVDKTVRYSGKKITLAP